MGFSSGGISPNNVDLDSSQTLQNKTLDASNDFSGDIINPSRSDVKQDTQANLETYASGAANGQMCFATDTKQMYQVLDGALAPVGGGSGGLDTFFTDTFEIAGVDDYTSGNDAAFDNGGVLAGALAVEAVNNISGDQSLKYTQAAGSLNDFIKSPLIPIDKKQQGNTVGLELYYTYSGNDGDLRIVGYDDTGSEVMTIASNTLKAASKAQRFSVQFPVPSGSANLAWGIQVGIENDGAILVIDDVQMSTNPFVSKELLVTETAVGSYQGSFWDGTGTQDGFNISLVDNSDNSLFSIISSGSTSRIVAKKRINIAVGFITQSNTAGATNVYHSVLGQIANQQNNAAITAFTTNVNTILEEGEYVYAVALNLQSTVGGVSITATAATNHIIAYNSRNAENSMIRLHTGNGHGSVNNKIRRFSTEVANLGNAITYADSATDGASFTINEDGVYSMVYTDVHSVAADIGLSLNSTQLTSSITTINAADRLSAGTTASSSFYMECSWSGILNKGDIIRVHTGGAVSGTNAGFTISKIGVGDLLGVPTPRTAYIKDVKPSGTDGGTFTFGAWQTRDLNTLEGDTEFVSISSNQFTLQPGKYEIESLSMAFAVNSNIAKLRNITDSTDDIIGMPTYSGSADTISLVAPIIGVIEITSETTYEIQHRCETTKSSNGFGARNTFGVDNTYTTIKIKKIS